VVIGIDCGPRRRQPWSLRSSASTVVIIVIGRGRHHNHKIDLIVAWSSQAWSLWSLQFNWCVVVAFNDHKLIVAWSSHLMIIN
jgi:hypothetical protein